MTKNRNPQKIEHKNNKNVSANFVIGIDEVGRGPVAGPVTVCAVLMTKNAYKDFKESKICEKLRDSKKLSEKRREEWFDRIQEWQKEGMLDFAFFNLGAEGIDKFGIVSAIQKCLNKCLEKLDTPLDAKIMLDGGLQAPDKFIDQEAFIKGDANHPIIALASIVAKVNRDNYMKEKASEYPEYGLETHKGYGTKKHMEAIEKYGLSNLHRKSFLRRFI
jgi:ribonuclease HII